MEGKVIETMDISTYDCSLNHIFEESESDMEFYFTHNEITIT